MFIWDEWPHLFRGVQLPLANADLRTLAANHRLIEAALAESGECLPDDEATCWRTGVIAVKAEQPVRAL